MLSIEIADSDKQIKDVAGLLETYAAIRNYDEALGDYKNEIRSLPGNYGPPSGILLIAYMDEKPAGCIAYKKLDHKACEMKRLFVLEEFRGHGIGFKLAEKSIELAKENGYTVMRLDSHPWMKDAMKIYAKLGFQERDPYHFNPTLGIKYFELEL